MVTTIRSALVLLSASLAILLAGCQPGSSPESIESPKTARKADLPPKGTTLHLLVVDDPAMTKAIGQLRGEWTGQSGYELAVQSLPLAQFESISSAKADAVIFPSSQLGTLAEKQLILPLPDQLIRNDQGSWSEIFPLLRSRELTWAAKPVAVPFGSPVLTCYCRADLLEILNRKPPTTWADYKKLAAMLADRSKLGKAAPPEGKPWHGALEPLAPGWAGITLLAHAAAYASHRGNYSVLFNIDTLEPLIAGAPFVRALEELVATSGSGDVPQLKLDPAAIRKAFWDGQCGMALTWPSATDTTVATPGEPFRVVFAEMPGSEDVYNVTDQSWQRRREDEDRRVPLLAVAGRTGAVLRTTAWPDASFQLLLWLSDRHWSQQVSPVSPATTLFRESHLKMPAIWVEKPVPIAAAADYALLTSKSLTREQQLLALSIPGRQEYLSALDEAVAQAVRGQKKPQEALTQAATRWKEISQRLGIDAQRKAYAHSIGLD